MISGYDDHLPARRPRHPAQKAVINLLRMAAGSAVIKDIARYKQNINVFCFDKSRQPVQEYFVFIIPFSVMERAADVQSEVWRIFIFAFSPIRIICCSERNDQICHIL